MIIPVDTFQRKTYGRIFVQKEEDVAVVLDVLKEVDEYEFSHYAPKDLVGVYGDHKTLVYLHKFEMDKNAIFQACAARGVWVWCVDGGREIT